MAHVPRRHRIAHALPEQVRQRLQRLQHGENPSLTRAVARSSGRGVTPAVVPSFDVHAVRAEVADTVVHALAGAGVPYVLVPGPHRAVRQVGVAAEHRTRAMTALATALTGPGWAFDTTFARRTHSDRVRAYRVLSAAGGQILCGTDTACEIGFWPVLGSGRPRVDGARHAPGTRFAPSANGVAGYLTDDVWTRATTSADHWIVGTPLPDAFEVTEPIDLVYTWVDGSDPAWQARRAEYSPGVHLSETATHSSRYLCRNELRHSMRSVAMYANWVRTIYVVTDDQVPRWLDPSHPKIRVVHHREIFDDRSALPVFNSHAIESQLHHIDGLAERYLYLNDDMFFGRPVDPELFFLGNEIEKIFLSKDTIDAGPPSARDLPATTAAKNQRDLIEQEFGRTVYRKFQHAAHPQLRSVLEEMEKRHPDLFATVARSRFRDPADHSIPSALQHSYALALGRAVPAQWDYQYQDIGRSTTPRALDGILRRRPQSFCLNDMGTEEISPQEQGAALDRFFGEYFPLAAPWEIPGT